MPHCRLTLQALPSDADLPRLASEITDLIATVLRKRHELTSVLIEQPCAGRWTIGAQAQTVAAYLEVTVTEGTNTAVEAGQFIAAAMLLLRRHVAALPEATYVVVRGVAADHWGYDGQTQARRAASRTA